MTNKLAHLSILGNTRSVCRYSWVPVHLSSDYDALVAHMAQTDEGWKSCTSGLRETMRMLDKAEARIRDLEAALREIARRESEAREIVTQNRWPSTLAIDLASQARLALEPPVSKSQQKRIDALTAPETTGEPK